MSFQRKKRQRTQALPSVSSHATDEMYKTHRGIWYVGGEGLWGEPIINPELSHPALPLITQAHLPIFMPYQLFCGLMSRAFCNDRGSKGWSSVQLHCTCWSRHSTEPRLLLWVALTYLLGNHNINTSELSAKWPRLLCPNPISFCIMSY